MDMQDLAEIRREAQSLASWASADLPSDHDPKWHEFGVLGHIEKVFRNAMKIRDETGIDVVKVALWHDIGKFCVRRAKRDIPGEFSFKCHEEASVAYLRGKYPTYFDDEELFLIANHAVIRGDSTAEQIVDLCNGSMDVLKRLVFLCAADICGKGFTPDQQKQRDELAPKFYALALQAGLTSDLAKLVQQIVLPE